MKVQTNKTKTKEEKSLMKLSKITFILVVWVGSYNTNCLSLGHKKTDSIKARSTSHLFYET